MNDDKGFTFDISIDHWKDQISTYNCTSAAECQLNPAGTPKCLPVHCSFTKFDEINKKCRNCTKVCSSTALFGKCPPVDKNGAKENFIFGKHEHAITMKCPADHKVQGKCSTDEVPCVSFSWSL